jgi:hypothetical protein
MGGASRADRYRLLVGESCVEGVGAGVGGSCQTIRFVNFAKVGYGFLIEDSVRNYPYPHLYQTGS